MKKIIILALVALLTLSSLSACTDKTPDETDDSKANATDKKIDRLPAVEVSGEGLEFTLSEDKSYYTFTSTGTCADEKITVPATYNGLPVKGIGENSFTANKGITEITLSEGITELGKGAFALSSNLKTVKLPNSLTVLSERAFYGCEKLESITFGNATASIGASAFENCCSLKTITLPDTVKGIGAAAFYNCTALADIKLGGSIEKISHSAFDGTAFVASSQNWQNKELYCGQYLLKISPDKADALNVKDGTLLIAVILLCFAA